MSRENGKLNPRQERFVAEYIADPNGRQAAIRAGYSPNGAEVTASKLLRVPNIARAVAAGQERVLAKVGITADRVLAELEMVAFSDVDNYSISDGGDIDLTANAPKLAKRAIASIKRKSWSDGEGSGHTVETEYRFWNKMDALKLAGRYAQVPGFAERVEVSAPGGGPVDVQVFTGLPPDDEDDEPAKATG